MKDLFLMRHGEAESGSRPVPDSLRALTPRGRQNCIQQGKKVHPHGPHRLVTSSAIRTIQTAGLVTEVWSEMAGATVPQIEIEERGYLAEPDMWIQLAASTEDRYSGLWLIGHNPGMSALVTVLTGEYMGLSTSDLVHIRLHVDHWHAIGVNSGQVVERYPPQQP